MLAPRMSMFEPLVRLQDEMNRLFESAVGEMPVSRPYSAMYPAMNVWDEGEMLCVEAELPGLKLEEIELLCLGNQLTINGKREIPQQAEASYHRRERAYGEFSRTLTLPCDINADKIEATLHDGVLTVRLPKAECAKPRKVKVLTT